MSHVLKFPQFTIVSAKVIVTTDSLYIYKHNSVSPHSSLDMRMLRVQDCTNDVREIVADHRELIHAAAEEGTP